MTDKKEKKKKSVRKPRSLHDEAVKEYFSDIKTAKSFYSLPGQSQQYKHIYLLVDRSQEQGRTFYGLPVFEIHGKDMGIASQAKQESRVLAGDNPHCDLSRSREMGSG